MIVRNEAPVIRRCLESVLPLIDYVLIVDTGSTDATRTVVRDFLSEKNIAGEVIDEPWQNFAYNRTFALRKLREKRQIDYSLMVDADQIMVYEADFTAERFKETLREDLYDIRLRTGSIEYLAPHLSSNRVDVAYKGVLHEYRECPTIAREVWHQASTFRRCRIARAAPTFENSRMMRKRSCVRSDMKAIPFWFRATHSTLPKAFATSAIRSLRSNII